MGVGHDSPLHLWRRRPQLGGPHVRPDETTPLDAGICLHRDLIFEAAFCWLVRHVDTHARHVVFPAVIHASEAFLLIPPEEKGGPAMGAMGVEQADSPATVAIRDQVLA